MNATIAHALPALVLGLFLKSTLLLTGAALACRLLRRASAATRHLIWSAALGGVLLLPLLSPALPHWNVPLRYAGHNSPITPLVPAPSPAPSVTAAPSIPTSTSSWPQAAISDRRLPPITSDSVRSNPGLPLADVGVFVWLVGSFVVFARLAIGLRRVGEAGRQSRPLSGEHEHTTVEEARRQVGLRRPVRVLRTSTGGIPLTWGAVRPIILVPAQSTEWSQECLKAALLHEMAHVRRWDWPIQLSARLACTLWWWHPLVWWAARQARAESERACDDLVLTAGMRATDYAQCLVEVVRSLPTTPPRTIAIAMAQPSEVEGRLRAVLAKGRNRRPLTRRRLAAFALALGLPLLPLAALRPIVQAQAVSTPQAAGGRRMERDVLDLVYLKDVACDRAPGRPIQLSLEKDATGHEVYHLFDTRTGLSFRDTKTGLDEFQKVLAQGYAQRPGASPYLISTTLAINLPTSRDVLFTPAQRRQADELTRENDAFIDLYQNFSPRIVTDADVEKAEAHMNNQTPPVPTLSLTLTPEGGRKMKEFTAAHKGEIMGILVNEELRSAPVIRGVIDGSAEISGCFRSLAEAQAVASQLNAPAPMEYITPASDKLVYPDGTVYETLHHSNDPVPVASGYRATLPNGYTVEVLGVAHEVAQAGQWVSSSGPWWGPDGTPLPQAPITQDTSPRGWGINDSHGGIPTDVATKVIPPPGLQPVVNTPGDVSWFGIEEGLYGPMGDGPMSAPSHTSFSCPATNNTDGGALTAVFSRTARVCSCRVGIAAGPWQTKATLPMPTEVSRMSSVSNLFAVDVQIKLDDRPAVIYQDASGRRHVDYFLGSDGLLGHVARRVVAVDEAGTATALEEAAIGLVSVAFRRGTPTPLYSGQVDLTKVKAFRLETRPYQSVEFHNIQLQPRAGSG